MAKPLSSSLIPRRRGAMLRESPGHAPGVAQFEVGYTPGDVPDAHSLLYLSTKSSVIRPGRRASRPCPSHRVASIARFARVVMAVSAAEAAPCSSDKTHSSPEKLQVAHALPHTIRLVVRRMRCAGARVERHHSGMRRSES